MDYSLIEPNGLLIYGKIRPLIDTEVFPLSNCAKRAFEAQKKDLGDVNLMSIDEDQSFVLEMDASYVAFSATLIQNGKWKTSSVLTQIFEPVTKDVSDG